jgi:hypothetical protein
MPFLDWAGHSHAALRRRAILSTVKYASGPMLQPKKIACSSIWNSWWAKLDCLRCSTPRYPGTSKFVPLTSPLILLSIWCPVRRVRGRHEGTFETIRTGVVLRTVKGFHANLRLYNSLRVVAWKNLAYRSGCRKLLPSSVDGVGCGDGKMLPHCLSSDSYLLIS